METDDLVAVYAAAAAGHGDATSNGDSLRANREHDAVASSYRELRRRGERDALLPLLSHPHLSVRQWVASHALEFAPEKGEPVLMEIETGGHKVASFSATMTLREWRAG